MKKIISALIVISLLSACKSSRSSSSYILEQHKWILSELNGNPVQMSNTDKDAHLQFTYKDMRITGSGGCNTIAGTFTSTRNKLFFGPVLSTKMACENMKFEDTFLQALAQTNRYELTAHELVLKNNNQVIARLLPR